MQVLGLDISQTSTGWAVLKDSLLIDYGTLEFDRKKRLGDNLMLFHEFLKSILLRHQPLDVISIEDTFTGKNPKVSALLTRYSGTAIVTSRLFSSDSRMLLLAVASIRSSISTDVKKFLAANNLPVRSGLVDKEEVFKYICSIHKLKNIPNDVTDAIAAATVPFTKKEIEDHWVI
jgi:Holliday junction resolvasome RuvABC endonuclease subunit